MANQKINHNERYMLRGALKKNGFDRWRLVTNGVNVVSGEELAFFIEFYVVNPAVSPEECVLGFKNRAAISEDDLHAALTGASGAADGSSEPLVKPSFAMVKAGVLRENGKQMNVYYPASQIQVGHTDLLFKVGTDESNYCSLTTTSTYGTVNVSKMDLVEHPEILGQSGKMSWNLRYSKQIGFTPDYKGKKLNWSVSGAKTVFEGKIILDGEEYEVTSPRSNGYFDKSWGKELTSSFFHLSSSRLTSIINGKVLPDSCFVVQGVYNDSLSVLVSLNGKNIEFNAKKAKRYELTYDLFEMPSDGEEESKFHWSVSASDKTYVVDVDCYCNTKTMFLRKYECPEGNRKVLCIAGSGSGTGELRLYRKIKKNLELIEHVRIANMLCEYGDIELPVV